ncbi:MAG: DedA family protein [Acidimicrobiales bacterium]
MISLLNVTNLVASSGYVAIFVLSILQSCCVPTSSELTLGFAGVLAAQGKLSLPAVIVVGASGEIVGAYIAWAIGRFGGRAFVERYGKYVLMSSHDLDRAQAWYERHERWGVFASRLLPVIRNFVAVPAGVAEVPLVSFGILTALGSLIWDAAMAFIGYEIGGSWRSVMKGFNDAGYLLAVVAVIAIAFVIWHRWKAYHRATSNLAATPLRPDAEPGLPVLRPPVRKAFTGRAAQARSDLAESLQADTPSPPGTARRPESSAVRSEGIDAALLPERYRRAGG